MQVDRWQDGCVPVRFLAQRSARLWAWLLWPWAAVASSRLERSWDVQAQAWRQVATHTQHVTGLAVHTSALIAPQIGCTRVAAQAGGRQTELEVSHSFQRADLGVPAWELRLPVP
jgi:hypothetical protein